MSTENQNLAGKLAALAQKKGSKPLVKIIGGLCAAIVALVAFCSIFGNPSGVEAVKNSVWEYDKAITFEEAVARFCEKTSVDENFHEDKASFSRKREYSSPEWTDSGATSTGAHVVTLKIYFLETKWRWSDRWFFSDRFKKDYPDEEFLSSYGEGSLTYVKCRVPRSYTFEFLVSPDGKVSERKGSVKAIYDCSAER